MIPAQKKRLIAFSIVVLLTLGLAYFAGYLAAQKQDQQSRPSHPQTRPPFREVTQQTTAATRSLAFFDLLDSCTTPADFQNLIEALESSADKTEKNRLLATLFTAWLNSNPSQALAHVRRVESLRRDPTRVSEAFFQWATKNPDAAATLLAAAFDKKQTLFLDGLDPPDFLLSLVSGLAQTSPQLAATTLQNANSSLTRTSAIEVLLQDWYPADPAAVQSWATSLPDSDTRNLALETAATKAGQLDDTTPGLSWATSLPDPAERQRALAALTAQWSQRRSAEAFAFTTQLTDESLKLSLMPAVLRQFALIDPGAAADWLNQYEAAPAMDESVAAYAKAIQFTNPAAALESATAITSPTLRDATIQTIARNQNR